MSRQHVFIAGVMRSGTTYLATVLDEHPSINFAQPIVPERKFFLLEQEFQKGKRYYESRYFSPDSEISVYGEKTVHYSEHPEAIERIITWYPNAKFILILRNPVYRAVSNYLFSVKNELETRSPEEVFLQGIPEPDYDKNRFFISPFAYVKRGEYLTVVQLASRLVQPENLRILLTEETVGSQEQISRLYSWLGVEEHYSPPSLDTKIFSNSKAAESINRDVLTFLHRYYKPHNRALQNYTGMDLSNWQE